MNLKKLFTLFTTTLTLSLSMSVTAFSPFSFLDDFSEIRDLGFEIEEKIKITHPDYKDSYLLKVGPDWVVAKPGSTTVMLGEMIDLTTRTPILDEYKNSYNIKHINTYPQESLITYTASNETSEIFVFTDSSCPYCRKLHQDVPELNKNGVTVSYIPFPRGYKRGPGYADLVSVWCAEDKNAALDAAKETSSVKLEPNSCNTDEVAAGYMLGNKVGVTGTPAIYTTSGKLISGYVPPKDLLERIK